jgi:membrane protease YdiL (CAAX protease family)
VSTPVTIPPAPPGWYPDPWHQAWWRWWDGRGWTAYTELSTPAVPEPAEPGALRAGVIAFLGFLVGMALGVAIDIPLIVIGGLSANDPAVLLGSSLGLWIGIGGSCVVAVRVKGTGSLRDLGLARPRGVDAALGLGFGVAFIIAVSMITALLNSIDPDLLPGGRQDLTDPLKHGSVLGVLAVYLVAVVGAPFFEELYFRGLVQGTLTARWGPAVAMVVQAMLFALVHLTPDAGLGNVGIYLMILTVGLGLGAIRRYSHRLDPGMFTHATYNAIIVTIGLLAR